MIGEPQAVNVPEGVKVCPAQMPGSVFTLTCGGAPTVTCCVTGNVPQELIACKVTV
ncbi:MAG: hypothetical protein QM724_14020 [Flavobacteriales bacterium]